MTLTDAADMRYFRTGGHEAIRRVYAAVRAADWFTVPSTIVVREKTVGADSFRVVHDVRYFHEARDIDFRATVTVTGSESGVITFDFHGEAFSEFERARIGVCVLHPAEARGAAVTVTHTNGDTETGNLPGTISPHQPFFDIAAISHIVAPSVVASVSFTGDVFEMEDQRNWLDASFKTYSTPQSRPKPVRVKIGDIVTQSVTFSAVGASIAVPEVVAPVTVMVSEETVGAMPTVGRELPPMGNAFGVTGDFTELNRNRPALSEGQGETFDAVYFGGNPQVHANDDLSIMETPATITDAIRTARTFANGKPVYVGTLRFGGGDDPRQSDPVGQAWYAAITYCAINAGAAGIALDATRPLLMTQTYDPNDLVANAIVRAVSVSDNLAVAACAVAGTDTTGANAVVLHLVNLRDAPQAVRVLVVGDVWEDTLKPYEVSALTIKEQKP